MPYTVTPTALPELLMLEPKVFGDARWIPPGFAHCFVVTSDSAEFL